MSREIVRYRPEHKLAVARLMTPLWSPDVARNVAYLEWKYERNPYAGEPRIWLAVDDAEVVGIRGLSGACWTAGASGASVDVQHSDDMLVAEAHRKSGLASAITTTMIDDATRAGLGALLSLTPSPVTTLVSLAAGWKTLGVTRPARRVLPHVASRRALRDRLSRVPFLWRFAERIPFLHAWEERHPFAALDRAGATSRPRGAGDPVVEDAPRTEAMAALAERAASDGRWRHVRDRAYLEWRLASPLCRHRFLYCASAHGLAGYLVLEQRLTRYGRGVVTISDWEAPDPRVRDSLLRAALDWGRFGDVVTWSATLPVDTREMLDRAGLHSLDDGTALGAYRSCVLLRVTAGDAPTDLQAWDLRPLWAA